MTRESARISFLIDSGKRDSLEKIASAYGKNMSTVISEAIDQYIDVHERHASLTQIETDAPEAGDFATD